MIPPGLEEQGVSETHCAALRTHQLLPLLSPAPGASHAPGTMQEQFAKWLPLQAAGKIKPAESQWACGGEGCFPQNSGLPCQRGEHQQPPVTWSSPAF